MTRRCLAAGRLDEIDIDLVPILLGEGVPLFRELAGRARSSSSYSE